MSAAVRELARTMYEKLARDESIVDEVEQLDFVLTDAERLSGAANAYLRAGPDTAFALRLELARVCAEVAA